MLSKLWYKLRWRRLTVPILVVLVAGAAVAPAAAIPGIVLEDTDVSQTTAVVGENVTVSATVRNVGEDGGGVTLSYTRNLTEFGSERVQVPGETERQFNETVRFDSPGRYVLRVNEVIAGTVTVERGLATVERADSDRRTVEVRARTVPVNESYAVEVPPATNRSFAVERWSVRAEASNYTQTLTEYGTVSAANVTLPGPDQSGLVGVVTVDSPVSIGAGTMRVAVDDGALAAVNVTQDRVTVYQLIGTAWEPLETTVVAQRNRTTVYRATGTSAGPYAVGRIDPRVSLSDTSLSTTETEEGQRLVVDGLLRNDGQVDGEYAATLAVNGEAVNTSRVAVPAGSEREVVLTHEVTAAGTYDLTLTDTVVGSVVITA